MVDDIRQECWHLHIIYNDVTHAFIKLGTIHLVRMQESGKTVSTGLFNTPFLELCMIQLHINTQERTINNVFN
jgi:hypothetical protein